MGGSEKRGCWWYSWIPCWLLTNAAVTSAVTEFQVPQIDCKSKKSKRTVTWKILFAMSIGKTRIVKSDNLQNNLVYTKTGKELQGGGGNSRASTGVAWPSCSHSSEMSRCGKRVICSILIVRQVCHCHRQMLTYWTTGGEHYIILFTYYSNVTSTTKYE